MITLLTDFGLTDHYVGVMKGVIAEIAPRAAVVDISHGVAAYQLPQARFLLAQSWPYFPKGTIHLAIVDPGVGSARRPLLVKAGGHWFIGPDNGLLTDLIRTPKAVVRHLNQPRYWRKELSATFHGRDLFAPVAAHLAAGVPATRLGNVIRDAVQTGDMVPFRSGRRLWNGEVVHSDHFGNLITSYRLADFPDLAQRRFCFRIGFRELTGVSATYSAGESGEPVILLGSSGHFEIAVNQGSAAKALGCGVGSPVELELL